ncbi:MAG: hypothetical protein QF383_04035, partial [Flavobacteriales bacterium]|nr:hypothetical protein [Flavobacteriales bacterium]
SGHSAWLNEMANVHFAVTLPTYRSYSYNNNVTDSTLFYYSGFFPTAIEEQNIVINNDKELLLITDLLGRETKGTKNEVLFYIYDDGTVEKRIVIE